MTVAELITWLRDNAESGQKVYLAHPEADADDLEDFDVQLKPILRDGNKNFSHIGQHVIASGLPKFDEIGVVIG